MLKVPNEAQVDDHLETYHVNFDHDERQVTFCSQALSLLEQAVSLHTFFYKRLLYKKLVLGQENG